MPHSETRINTQRPQRPADAGSQGKLPHERDQSVAATTPKPTPEMQQAHRDLKKGLVDTDSRGADGQPLGDDIPTP